MVCLLISLRRVKEIKGLVLQDVSLLAAESDSNFCDSHCINDLLKCIKRCGCPIATRRPMRQLTLLVDIASKCMRAPGLTQVPLPGKYTTYHDDSMMRYLGIHRDMGHTGQTILGMGKLKNNLTCIKTFPCTADIKNTLVRCVYPSLVFQVKFANWSLTTFRTLDQKIGACIKRILELTQSRCSISRAGTAVMSGYTYWTRSTFQK